MSELKVGPRIQKPQIESTTTPPPTTTQATQVSSVTAPTPTTPQTNSPQLAQAPVAALFAETKKEATTKKPGTFKPHEALMTSVNKPKHQSFAAAFQSVLGKNALDELQAAIGHKPIVLIAGDQYTA